jgi:predicted metal-dependent hydrolase
MLEYKLLRSSRKTLTIQIAKTGEVLVKAPYAISRKRIEDFIFLKEDWIIKHKKIVEENCRNLENFKLDPGNKLLLVGKEYPIIYGKNVAFLGDSFSVIKGEEVKSRQLMVEVYKDLAKSVIINRVKDISDLIGLKPTSINITSAKTRWGSCSGKNTLNFSYKLLMAEFELIDYVIIHELCHLKEHNHSDEFWVLVSEFIPDYKEKRLRLRKFEKNLQIRGIDI